MPFSLPSKPCLALCLSPKPHYAILLCHCFYQDPKNQYLPAKLITSSPHPPASSLGSSDITQGLSLLGEPPPQSPGWERAIRILSQWPKELPS